MEATSFYKLKACKRYSVQQEKLITKKTQVIRSKKTISQKLTYRDTF